MTVLWRVQRERGGRRITKFYIWLCLAVGRRLARPILYGIALYFFITAPLERRASADYLSRISGQRTGLSQIYRHFFTFSTVIMDRLFFLAGRTEDLNIVLHGTDAIDALIQSGKGFILVSGHLGSFEALRVLAISEKVPIKVLMYVDNARQLNEFLDAVNPEIADSIISLGQPGAILEVKEWLEQGHIVGILADRITQGEKLARVDFLGEEAEFPLGPWLLAGMLRVPVMLCFAIYSGQGRYDVYFEPLSGTLEVDRGNRTQVAQDLAAGYAERLAHYCRMAPYNWFNFFDFWATTQDMDTRSPVQGQ